MNAMARMPDSVKTTLTRRLETHRAARWPQLARIDVRYRGDHAYIDAVTPRRRHLAAVPPALGCVC